MAVQLWMKHAPVLRAIVENWRSDERLAKIWMEKMEGFATAATYRIERDRATLTFVTPEPSLGHLDIGALVAVIAAYKDLPDPVKELIDWDQERLDVSIKYGQVIEQPAQVGDHRPARPLS